VSRFHHRTWAGEPDADGNSYRIQLYEDSEYGWSFVCRPTVRGALASTNDEDDYCARHIGAFQSYSEGCRAVEDHERRKHLIRAVA
jgi:hypothetical protein